MHWFTRKNEKLSDERLVKIDEKALHSIIAEARRLAEKIGAPKSWIPVVRSGPNDKASSWLEMNAEGTEIYWFSLDDWRGTKIFHEWTNNPKEMIYFILEHLTFSIAVDYELKHRVKGQDSRHILYAKQEELLEGLNPAWGERCRRHHEEILKDHPFVADIDDEDVRRYQGGKWSCEDPSKTMTSYSIDGSEDIVRNDISSLE